MSVGSDNSVASGDMRAGTLKLKGYGVYSDFTHVDISPPFPDQGQVREIKMKLMRGLGGRQILEKYVKRRIR